MCSCCCCHCFLQTVFLNRKEKLLSFNLEYSSLLVRPTFFLSVFFGQVRPDLEEIRRKYEEISKKYEEIKNGVSEDTCNLVLLVLCIFLCFCSFFSLVDSLIDYWLIG